MGLQDYREDLLKQLSDRKYAAVGFTQCLHCFSRIQSQPSFARHQTESAHGF
jgi:hypothetical protein